MTIDEVRQGHRQTNPLGQLLVVGKPPHDEQFDDAAPLPCSAMPFRICRSRQVRMVGGSTSLSFNGKPKGQSDRAGM